MTRRNKLTALLGVATITAAALFASTPAFAHARYKSSTPGTGEVLAAPPARVEITFTEQIQKVSGTYSIEIARDRGASVTSGAAVVNEADRTKLSVPLQAGLAAGRYVVNWTNASDDDGDPANGAFSFYINTQPSAADIADDRRLAQIGFEDVTATAGADGASTPTSASAPSLATTTSGAQSPGIPAATRIPTASITNNGGGGGDSRSVYIGVAVVLVALIAGLGAWQYLSRRRT